MSRDHFKMVVATHVFLIRDNKILLTRRFQTGYEDGNFSVPAGHVEEGESISEATIREAKEEVGVNIEPRDLRFFSVMNRKAHRESIDFFFTCTKWLDEPQNIEPNKCDLIQWTNIDHLPENTVQYIKRAIQGYLEKESFLELDY